MYCFTNAYLYDKLENEILNVDMYFECINHLSDTFNIFPGKNGKNIDRF